jgi:hypothetical protein
VNLQLFQSVQQPFFCHSFAKFITVLPLFGQPVPALIVFGMAIAGEAALRSRIVNRSRQRERIDGLVRC